jgi:DNA-binding protein HU-beta
VNKRELVRAVSNRIDLNQDETVKVITAVFEEITQALSKGDNVKLVGFGNFTVSERVARIGRNPKTGVPIPISARSVPKFTAGKILREAVRSRK